MKRITLPPPIKYLEAVGALADHRVNLTDTGGSVTSSSGNKAYDVLVDLAARRVTSNDNGTYYLGYVGYPIIAILMARDLITSPRPLAHALANVAWKDLNVSLGNDYDKLLQWLIDRRHLNRDMILDYFNLVSSQLEDLHLTVTKATSKPPSGY